MTGKYLRTSDLARAAGVHPNTVRLYVTWGLIPPVERSASGYRLFTQHHLDCLRLARMIYAASYPGREFRAQGNEIIQRAVAGDWPGAVQQGQALLSAAEAELAQADQTAGLLERWAESHTHEPENETRLEIGAVAKCLGVSIDVIRNAERNGLIAVPRNPLNNYRLFGKREIERLRIIRMLTRAGYSHMAILRMFTELDAGNTRDLLKVLDTPRPDEDIFTAADHWVSTLREQKSLAEAVIRFVKSISDVD